jgi:alpha,alpha-trehalose phosphorylase
LTSDDYPLLLHFPYFDLYRKQVVKQADLVMALYECGHAFTDQEKARDFAYYERICVRDSSLSACTQAVIAAEVGHVDLAYDYFAEAAMMDLDDLEHNTRDGIHIASVAGTWIAAVAGFGGMRDHKGKLSFRPRLPSALTALRFHMMVRGRNLMVEVTHEHARYRLREGDPLDIEHHGEPLTVTTGEAVQLSIPELKPRGVIEQPRGRAPARRRTTPRA